MKLLISHSDAIAQIRSALNLHSNITIVIGRKPKPTKAKTNGWPKFWDELANANDLTRRGLDYIKHETTRPGGMDNKIAVIKEIRALTGNGLKEAKDSVENWPRFLEACIKLNRWPEVSYGRDYNSPDYIRFV